MKRGTFKRKLYDPSNPPTQKPRKPLAKAGKQPISKIQKKLWELCKQLTRKKYGNICYTCGQKGLEGSNWQTGHLIPKAAIGAYLKYDLRVLRPQCYRCNINLGGNGAEFLSRMEIRDGNEYIAQIYQDRQKIVKAYDHYLFLIEEYTKLLNENEPRTNLL